jgi:tetratricopeptide (TPR) repeat protein
MRLLDRRFGDEDQESLALHRQKYYRQGERYYRQGDYAKAVEALRRGIATEPVYAAYVRLGEALQMLERFEEAATAFEMALNLDDSEPGLYATLANCYIAAEHWDEALALLTKTLSRYQTADLYYDLGCVYSAKRMYDQAIEAQRRALAFNPQDVDALYNLGVDLCNKYFEENDCTLLDEALATLERCLAIDPNQADVRTDLDRMQRIQVAASLSSAERSWDDSIVQRPGDELGVGGIISLRHGSYQYRVEEIRRGGMGIVYIARNLETQDLDAVKTFRGDSAGGQHVLERFSREARTWVQLDAHPNIVRAEYVEWLGDRLYILLEYVDGTSLRTWISQGPMSMHRALDFAIQFCSGMDYAYKKLGIVHRDIKPENILITRNRVVKVTDFGLAKTVVLGDEPEKLETESPKSLNSLSLTHTGETCGTPPYMSPEQFSDFRGVGIASDVYAFGVTLYEMLTGRLPFSARRPREYALMHLSQEPPSLRVLRPELPADLEAMVLRCLHKSPEERPPDFETLRADLINLFWQVTGERYVGLDQRGGEYLHRPAMGYSSLVDKGQSLRTLQHYEEAIECFRKAAGLNPGQVTAWANLAKCCRDLGRIEEAIEHCDRALALEPDSCGLWNFKGLLYLDLPDREEDALACLNRASVLAPHESGILVNEAICLDKLGRYEDALACCDQVPKQDSNAVAALTTKAQILWQMDRHEDAFACLDQALDIDPDNPQVRYNKRLLELDLAKLRKSTAQRYKERINDGLALLGAEEYQGALACFDEALKVDETRAAAWVYRADTLSEMGNVEAAMASYEGALTRDDSFFEAWFGLGSCLFDQERFEEALRCFERANRLHPEDEQVLISQGSSFANLERFQEAIACFDKALAIAPMDEAARSYRTLCQEYLDGKHIVEQQA